MAFLRRNLKSCVYERHSFLVNINVIKSSATPAFLLKQFLNSLKKLYYTWEILICCESLHKYLNEHLKIHVIF